MKTIGGWKWVHKCIPGAEKRKRKNLVKVIKVNCLNNNLDFSQYLHNPIVLITGDGHTLPEDVKRFEAFGIPHDLYCVNRSMLFFERAVTHWAAVDADESVWFAENVTGKITTNGNILRHTIGVLPSGYDVFWMADNELEGVAKHLWAGNSSMLAILSSIEMGYEKIVLAGVPLDNGPHWYEHEDVPGPEWIGRVYQQWMDVKMKRPEAEIVRSMSGYSAFIFGEATKEWLDGNNG